MGGLEAAGPSMSGQGVRRPFLGARRPAAGVEGGLSLSEIPLVVLCATLGGAEDFVKIARWGQRKLSFPRRLLLCERGIVSLDTLDDVMNALPASLFAECFTAWVESLCEKVMSRMRRGSAPFATRWARWWTRVSVLPVPAPARISSGPATAPSPCRAAARCSGLRRARWGGVMGGGRRRGAWPRVSGVRLWFASADRVWCGAAARVSRAGHSGRAASGALWGRDASW